MKPQTYIVVLPVEKNERKRAEHIENTTYQNFEEFVKKGKCVQSTVLGLSNFMDECNNQDINLENCWISYIHLIEKPF